MVVEKTGDLTIEMFQQIRKGFIHGIAPFDEATAHTFLTDEQTQAKYECVGEIKYPYADFETVTNEIVAMFNTNYELSAGDYFKIQFHSKNKTVYFICGSLGKFVLFDADKLDNFMPNPHDTTVKDWVEESLIKDRKRHNLKNS